MLVMTDYVTKFQVAVPLKTKTEVEVARKLWDNWITIFGPPAVLLSDNGTEFCDKVVKELCDLSGIERMVTAAYHPQTNGLVERLNGTLVQSLRTYAV